MSIPKQRKGRLLAPFLLTLLATLPSLAENIPLDLPIDCLLGANCYIQQYKDQDPKSGSVRDFACGQLANDGHSGTDFAIPTLLSMENGVPVIASAPGTVKAIRDGMPDISMMDPNAPSIEGRDCGNGVLISHDKGWETQYCHLRKGSVSVTKGQSVNTGTRLGLVGMSGRATFPHVHFTVRKDGQTIDPFDQDAGESCTDTQETLWKVPPIYQPGGFIDLGIHDGVPALDQVQAGLPTPSDRSRDLPALVVWAYIFAGQTNDIIEIELKGPPGQIGAHKDVLKKNQPFVMRAFGKRTPVQGWPPGLYTGTVKHMRGELVLDKRLVKIVLR